MGGPQGSPGPGTCRLLVFLLLLLLLSPAQVWGHGGGTAPVQLQPGSCLPALGLRCEAAGGAVGRRRLGCAVSLPGAWLRLAWGPGGPESKLSRAG